MKAALGRKPGMDATKNWRAKAATFPATHTHVDTLQSPALLALAQSSQMDRATAP